MAALGVIVFVLVLTGYAALEAVARGEVARSRPAAPSDFDLEELVQGWSEAAGELVPGGTERRSQTQGGERDEPEL